MSNAWGAIVRGVRRLAPVLALAFVFAISTIAGVVIHLDTAAGRRLVAHFTSSLVSALLVSDLRIERIDGLSPTTLRVARATLLDRLGKPVLVAEGVVAHFALLDILRGALGEDEVRVAIPDVAVERLAFALTRDAKRGGFTIESAFDTVTSGPRTSPPAPVFVALPRIRVASAAITTDQRGIERVNARVAGLSAALDVSPAGLVLSLKSADATIRELFSRDVKAELDGALRLPGTTRAVLDARVGELPVKGELVRHDSELELALESANLDPSGMRGLFGAWPFVVPLAARARAAGELPAMKASTGAELGSCRVVGSGSLALAPDVQSELAFQIEDFDLRSLDAAAPETALDFDASVSVRYAGELELETRATLGESVVAGYAVPPLEMHGVYARGAFTGTASIRDERLATNGTFRISSEGTLEFETRSAKVDLAALGRYGVNAKGRAVLHSRGVVEAGRVTATFDGSLHEPQAGAVRVENVVLRGRLDGPLKNPDAVEFELATEGERLAVNGVRLASFRATARGTGTRPSITIVEPSDGERSLEASADVELGQRTVLRNVRLESRRAGDAVTMTAKRVELGAGAVEAKDISLRAGRGRLWGSIRTDGKRRLVDITVDELELERLTAALGVEAPGARGRLDGRVQFEEVGHERNGSASLSLRDGAYPPVAGVDVSLRATFDGADVEAGAELTLSDVGRAELEARGSVRRSLFDPRAVHEVVGETTLAFAELDLAAASRAWLANTDVALAGHAEGSVTLSRKGTNAVPALSYRVKTDGLVVTRKSHDGERPSQLAMDVESAGELLTAGGSRFGLELSDQEGPWIVASVEHSLTGDALFGAGRSGAAPAILDAPVRAVMKAYGRPLRVFGAGAASVDRSIEADVDVMGSVRMPELAAKASLSGRASSSATPNAGRIDIALGYSAEREAYELEAHTTGGRDRIELSSRGRFGWFNRGLGRDWTAEGDALVSKFGLSPLGTLLDAPVGGEASGRCRFSVDSTRAEVLGELALERVAIDRHELGDGSVRLEVAGGTAAATFDLERGPSRLELVAETGLAWGKGALEFDPRKKGTLRVNARKFELAALRPLVRNALTRLSGQLNGHAELGWDATEAAGKGATRLRANATVTGGMASLAAGGGLIRAIEARALADGAGPLRIEFSGAARARQPNVEGKAALHLDGPRLKRLDAEFHLDSFPLVYDGVLMGRATSGARAPLDVSVVLADEGQTVDVHVPSVDITLPKSTDQSLIALADDPSISISDAPLDPESRRRAERGAGSTTVRLRLGKNVRLRRGALEVPAFGAVTVLPGGRMSGSVHFPQGGVVPALGQIFRIRRGTVSFANAEPKDGTVAIQAFTRVADGTLIEVEVSGTLGEPIVTFQSDPPRSDEEIVALLLGIQTDSTVSDENEHLKNTVLALAMNRLVQDSMLSGLQFGAGETTSGDSVSTVTMRVGSKVWFEGRTVRGSQTSVNQGERVSGVVDWRFAPSFSLRTQLGEVSGVEIRWSLRY